MSQLKKQPLPAGLSFFVAVVAMMASAMSYANNEGRRYIAEMVIFSYENSNKGLSERWPENLQIELPAYYQKLYKRSQINISELDQQASTPTSSTGLAPLSKQQIRALKEGGSPDYFLQSNKRHQLNGAAYRLRKKGGYRILFHESWPMTALSKRKSLPIRIRGGQRFGSQYELDGSIQISIARYLHVDTQLYLSDFSTQQNSEGQSVYRTTQVIPMKQSRKMRSKELHYIDHPEFGILIQFTPL